MRLGVVKYNSKTSRWVISLNWLHISLEEEYFKDNKWNFGYQWYDIFVTSCWSLGIDRTWYDGYLNGFGLGFVRATWTGFSGKQSDYFDD